MAADETLTIDPPAARSETKRFPGETADYRAARDRLLASEIALRRQMEAVAAERRALPPGGETPQDYLFVGEEGEVRLSQLIAPGHQSLAIYSFMFPRYPTDTRPGPRSGSTAQLPLEEGPCPSCTAILDQLDAVIPHSKQRMSFVAAANAPLDRILAFAKERGWLHLRLLSTAGNDYNRDYFGQSPEGFSQPMINVFQKDGDSVRHFWGSEMLYAQPDPGQDPRHAGTLEPLWNLFDLTREGRPQWDEQLDYSCCHMGGDEAEKA